MEFGGYAFATTKLTLEQWLWCIFFGCGSLIWGQIVTCIPKNCIPCLKIPCRRKKESEDEEEILDRKNSTILRMRCLVGLENKVKF